MLVPSNSPLPTNSQTPISAARIARSQAYLAAVDRAEKLARFGVLGFCAPPTSYGPSMNVMADVYQTPQVPVPNSTSSSLVTSSGSGVLDTSSNIGGPAPQVVPIDGTGQGVGNDPEYGPLTLQMRRPAGNLMCPTETYNYSSVGNGKEAPAWGDAFGTPFPLASVPSAGFMAWVKANPLLSGALILGALAVAGSGKTQRNRGRR
jgi:hypothetical protein